MAHQECIVTIKYRFKVEGDQLKVAAAVHDYLDNLIYNDCLGEYRGPGCDLQPEERTVESVDIHMAED